MAATSLLALAVGCGLAHAQDQARPFAVVPYGWVSGGLSWQQPDSTDPNGFLATARLGAEATAEPIHVRARVELDVQPNPVLLDAFVNWSPHPAFSLNFGQLKVPFSIGQLASETRRQLFAPNAVQELTEIGRDIGISVEGRVAAAGKSRAAFTSAVMNGDGVNQLGNLDSDFLFAQRLLITPLGPRERPMEGKAADPYLGVGGGWVVQGSDAILDGSTWAAELQFAVSLASIQGEFVSEALRESPNGRGVSGYGQLGFFIPAPWLINHIELVGRAGHLEADSPNIKETTVDAGLNLYIPETPGYLHDVKVQAAYRHTIQDEGTEQADDGLVANATVRF